MQTQCADGDFSGHSPIRQRFRMHAAAAVMACTAIFALGVTPAEAGALTLPGIEGEGSDTAELSPCEHALTYATAHADGYESSMPVTFRMLSAAGAAGEWLDVAALCPTRLAEGTVRGVITGFEAEELASRFGISGLVDMPDPVLDISDDDTKTNDELPASMDADSWDALIVAEDRAGFALEVLAARHDADPSLADLADRHKLDAQLLTGLGSSDPRRKVYAIDALVSDPDQAVDPSTGLRAPTAAVVEMNCALEQLNALTDVDKVPQPLTALVAGHLAKALDLGYPSYQKALLTVPSDDRSV